MLAHLKDNEFIVTQMRNFSPGEHERITRFLQDNHIEFTEVDYVDTGYDGPERSRQCRFDIRVSFDPEDYISLQIGDYLVIVHHLTPIGDRDIAVLTQDVFNLHFGIHNTSDICCYGDNPEIWEK